MSEHTWPPCLLDKSDLSETWLVFGFLKPSVTTNIIFHTHTTRETREQPTKAGLAQVGNRMFAPDEPRGLDRRSGPDEDAAARVHAADGERSNAVDLHGTRKTDHRSNEVLWTECCWVIRGCQKKEWFEPLDAGRLRLRGQKKQRINPI